MSPEQAFLTVHPARTNAPLSTESTYQRTVSSRSVEWACGAGLSRWSRRAARCAVHAPLVTAVTLHERTRETLHLFGAADLLHDRDHYLSRERRRKKLKQDFCVPLFAQGELRRMHGRFDQGHEQALRVHSRRLQPSKIDLAHAGRLIFVVPEQTLLVRRPKVNQLARIAIGVTRHRYLYDVFVLAQQGAKRRHVAFLDGLSTLLEEPMKKAHADTQADGLTEVNDPRARPHSASPPTGPNDAREAPVIGSLRPSDGFSRGRVARIQPIHRTVSRLFRVVAFAPSDLRRWMGRGICNPQFEGDAIRDSSRGRAAHRVSPSDVSTLEPKRGVVDE